MDYPGKVAAVVFTQGCNFRCPFCHNADLVLPAQFQNPISEEDILRFLDQRKGLLQGVAVTGGEPMIQPDLLPFLKRVKTMGFLVKADTNGSRPDVLKSLIQQELVDYVALDIKTSLRRYSAACGVKVNTDSIVESIKILLRAPIDYEFRSTMVRPFINGEDLEEMRPFLTQAKRYVLQDFVGRSNLIDSSVLDQRHYSADEYQALKNKWEKRPS